MKVNNCIPLPLLLVSIIFLRICSIRGEEDSVHFHESAYSIPPNPSLLLHDNTYNLLSGNVSLVRNESAICEPRQLHLSLGDNQKDDSKTGMHISFSVPYLLDETCHPHRIKIVIQYGSVLNPGVVQSKEILPLEDDDSAVIRQYDTISPVTGERYQSDFIYHVALNELEGDTEYSYSIQVHDRTNSEKKEWTEEKTISSMGGFEQVDTRVQRGLRGNKSGSVENSNSNDDRKNPHNSQQQRRHRSLTFTTAPTRESAARQKPVKFAIVGDLGQTYNSTITMLNILSSTFKHADGDSTSMETPTTALLIAGDMSYANTIQPQWDNWFNLIEPIAQKIPVMVAAGNHEIECDGETYMPWAAYENRFHMPNRLGEAVIEPVGEEYIEDKWGCAVPSVFMGTYDYGNAYYSFDYGMVKTIVLSSYSFSNEASLQYKWLLNELKSIDRKKTPWVIVMMHTQFYTTFSTHVGEKETTVMRESMESLFVKYRVNLVFSGHDHAYMRSKPMFNGTSVENGKAPIYVIVGEGGNREGHSKEYLHEVPEEWIASRDKSVYGFGTLEVANETSAQWKWIMGGIGYGFEDETWFTNQYL